MGTTILRHILGDWTEYELDDSIYVPVGCDVKLDTAVLVLPFDPARGRMFESHEYLLGIEQIRDVVEGLEAQLLRVATPEERLRAITHYAVFDAFIDPRKAIADDSSRKL